MDVHRHPSRPVHRAVVALAALALLAAGSPGLAQPSGGDAGLPDWAREHMERLVRGSGRWIASNAEWADRDPADEYGLEWRWALGERGVRGRLFGLKDGEEIATYWELHTFWHPGERRLVAQQHGADGAFATGTVRPPEDGTSEVEQTLYQPDGSEARLLHRSTADGARRVDRSFAWQDGAWQPRRTYTWHLQPE